MSQRTLVVASGLLASLVTSASASPDYGLDLSAGAGASIIYSDPCGGPFGATCTTPEVRLRGPSAQVRAMYGARHALGHGFALRWGAGVAGSFMTEAGATGSIVTSGGEIGLRFDRYFADVLGGLSYLRVRSSDGMTTDGATFAFGGSLGIDITPQIAAYARIDLSAMMEGYIGGASAGAGITLRL